MSQNTDLREPPKDVPVRHRMDPRIRGRNDCSICLCPLFRYSQSLADIVPCINHMLTCGHVFHKECIDEAHAVASADAAKDGVEAVLKCPDCRHVHSDVQAHEVDLTRENDHGPADVAPEVGVRPAVRVRYDMPPANISSVHAAAAPLPRIAAPAARPVRRPAAVAAAPVPPAVVEAEPVPAPVPEEKEERGGPDVAIDLCDAEIESSDVRLRAVQDALDAIRPDSRPVSPTYSPPPDGWTLLDQIGSLQREFIEYKNTAEDRHRSTEARLRATEAKLRDTEERLARETTTRAESARDFSGRLIQERVARVTVCENLSRECADARELLRKRVAALEVRFRDSRKRNGEVAAAAPKRARKASEPELVDDDDAADEEWQQSDDT
jgi:hypothetical protein